MRLRPVAADAAATWLCERDEVRLQAVEVTAGDVTADQSADGEAVLWFCVHGYVKQPLHAAAARSRFPCIELESPFLLYM